MQPRLVLGAPTLQHTAQDRRTSARASTSDEEPDWDKEMSIFTQRTMRPNQLATLRELESKVEVGKVGAACSNTTAPELAIGLRVVEFSGRMYANSWSFPWML
jgi:hypothetical protein